LQAFAASSISGIIGVFIALLALRLVLSLMGGNITSLFTILISFGLFFFVIASRPGYYFNLYLNGLILFILAVLPFFRIHVDFAGILFPLLLFNTVQLLLVFPALHFDAFDFISYEEDKPWQPGDDLF
jgi:hypothetical protein